MAIAETNYTYPPGPPTDVIGGHLLSLRRDPLQFLMDNMQYGDLTHLKFLKYDGYQINHPDLIRQVLTTDNKIWRKSIIYKRPVRDYLGNGLLTSDGEFWRQQRMMMQPAFHVKRISAYAETMVDYSYRMLEGWRDGEIRDIAGDMMRVTLFVVGKTLFDTDFRNESSTIADALEYMLNDISDASQRIIRLPDWMPTPAKVRKQQTIDMLNQIIMPMIEARRAQPEDRGDLLSMMMQAKNQDGVGMSDEQIRDEALTLVLAGHETTANALTWTLYALSQNPQIAEKLQAEINDVIGTGRPSLDDLKQLTYTEAVIKESMRLYPPAWSIARQAYEATQLGDYPIPKYATAVIPIWAVHHDERWYNNPMQFDPERWLDGRADDLPRYAYLPFGGGPRICIGNAFAMMEAQLILVCILQQASLTLAKGHKVVPEPLLTLRPKHGMRMHVQRH